MARKKGQISKFFVGIMLVGLMIGLAGFGVTNFGGTIQSVGKVGKVEIEVDQYARALQSDLRNLQQRVNQNISLEQATQFGLDAQVMGRLIAGAALENEVIRIGLSVGDTEVQRQLLATQGFRGFNGQFDRDAYEFALENNNLNAEDYEADLRRQTAGSILQSAVSSGVDAPQTYSDVVLAYLGERRTFSWLDITASTLADPVPTPTDTQLNSYFDANADIYVLPAAKRITYALLLPEYVADQVEVAEEDLRALYEARSAEYNTPELRLVERIVFATQAEAEAAVASIRAGGATFDDVVIGRGLTLADVDLGPVNRDSLGDGGDAVFGLAEPGVTDAADTNLGPGFYRVNAILAPRTTAFETVRADLQEEAAVEAANRFVLDQIAEIDDLLAGGVTLEEIADETQLQVGQLDWVEGDRRSAPIAAFDEFVAAATDVTLEDFPAIETLAEGGIFAIRLNAVIEERPDTFGSARAQVAIDWTAAETAKALAAESDGLLANLTGSASLSSLGLPVSVETNVKRDSVYLAQPPGFLEAIFQLENPGETTTVSTDTNIVIVQLNDILGADPADPDRDELQVTIRRGMADSIGQDALAAFSRALQLQSDVSINQTAINAVHAQFSGSSNFVPTRSNQGGMGGGHN
jgi:peptidyl-prolyl cis-trans isomerase D